MARLFTKEQDRWIHTAGPRRAWDSLSDVHVYHSEGQLIIMSIMDAMARVSSQQESSPPIARNRRRISRHTSDTALPPAAVGCLFSSSRCLGRLLQL